MSIQIPTPLPSDSDKVVSLLQNAALFGRIGDTEEALHFLRQAAECAGDNGDDARTLALARSAAELSGSLGPAGELVTEGRSGVHERRLPQPPPRSRPPVADAETSAEEEPVLLLRRTAPHSKPPEPMQAAEAKPVESAACGSVEDKAPESRSALAPPPLPSVRANGSRPPPTSTRPSPTPSRPAPASRPSPTPSRPAPASRPAPPSLRSRAPSPVASRPPSTPSRLPSANSRSSVAPSSVRTLAPAPRAPSPEVVHPSLRQAARVSVERSASDPGLFLVRVLEEGTAPEPGCTEALLVSIDPKASPFTG